MSYTFRNLPDFNTLPELREELEDILREIAEGQSVSDWYDFTLQNSWVSAKGGGGHLDASANPGYCSTGSGFVWLRGGLSDGTKTNGTTIATLPDELWPNHELALRLLYNDSGHGHASLHITTSGELQIYGVSGSDPEISLDGISFRIGQ